MHLLCCLWGSACLLLKDENLLDCDFDENVLSSMLENDYVTMINNHVVEATKVVLKNVGGSPRVQDLVEKCLKKDRL